MERLHRILQHVHADPEAASAARTALASHDVQGTASASPSTADLCDELGDRARIVPIAFHAFGARRAFRGRAYTIEAFEDNSMVRKALEQAAAAAAAAAAASATTTASSAPSASASGAGRVLVIDGGGSRRCALLGDQMVALLRTGQWSGAIVNGCVRDVDVWREWPVGVVAIGTCPRRSKKHGRGRTQVDVTLRRRRSQASSSASVDDEAVTIHPGDMVHVDGDGVIVIVEVESH